MRLNKKTESLLIDLMKNKKSLSQYISECYKDKSSSEKDELNGRFGELKNHDLANVLYADNIAYIVKLTHKAEDYLEEHGLIIELFDKNTFINIIRDVGHKNGIYNINIYDITSCGNSQIGWRQTDEYEWEIKIEAITDMLLVKRVSNEIESELKQFGFLIVDKLDDNSTSRFKRNLKFAHSCLC